MPGQPALRDTLVHSCHAQIIHLSWWDGSMSGEESWRREFPVGNYPDIGAVRVMWQGVWRGTQTYLETLQCDVDLERIFGHDAMAKFSKPWFGSPCCTLKSRHSTP